LIPVRIPKPAYLLSQLTPHEKPNAELYQKIADLVELYQLGQIQECYRAPRSNSLNFIFTTPQGKFVFRQQSLSEDTVAHEYEVLNYLHQRDFPAPRMLSTRDGQAWVTVDGALYSVYKFVEGYAPANFIWLPTARRDIIRQAGRALGQYHRAVEGLVPSSYKWDGYRPDGHRRWREGDLYRQALTGIRAILEKPTPTGAATGDIDHFARTHLAEIEGMLDLEAAVEGCNALSKLVIHGDYAPWNLLFHPHRPPFVLDFNAARLDLKIFDVMLATFFFAWHGGRLDVNRAMVFQTGYRQANQLQEIDLELAGDVFQWVMGRSLAERLRTHYLEGRFRLQKVSGLERFFEMCMLIKEQPQQMVAGLRG